MSEWLIIFLVPLLHLAVQWRRRKYEEAEHKYWKTWFIERDKRETRW
jgi:hypothetical protein